MGIKALAYRPWRGTARPSFLRFWPIARTGLVLILRRKIFWLFLIIGLSNFLFHFAIIYFLTRIQAELAQKGQKVPPFVKQFTFTEGGEGYRNFIFTQSTVVMILLAFAAAILVGNDFRFHSVSFYLSKPLGRVNYFFGKLLAASSLAALLTLIPALALFVEYGAFTESTQYWIDHKRVFFAILGTGGLVSLAPSILILGVSALCKRTIPIVLLWSGIFLFLPMVGSFLRGFWRSRSGDNLWGWGLLNFWSDLRWIANVLFGINTERYAERWPWAAAVVAAWMVLAVVVFWRRLHGAEVVR